MNISGAAAWRQSIRPFAQANIGPYLIFGLALALAQDAHFQWSRLALMLLWGLLAQCTIIWTNDVADADIDGDNTEPTVVSGGSRVLPEGRLERRSIARAAWLASAALMVYSALLAWFLRDGLILAGGVATLLLSQAYSCPPLQLSRRGHGEFLQALGIGLVLPLVGYSIADSGSAQLGWAALLPTVALGYCGNFLTALPDHAADQRCGKRSPVVRLGQRKAKQRVTAILASAGIAAAVTLPGLVYAERIGVLVLGFVLTLGFLQYARIRGLWHDRSGAGLEFSIAASIAGQAQLAAWLWLLLRG